MEETNEELPNFTITFEDDLALLQATESNEIESNESRCENFEVISNKRCFRAQIGIAML